MMVHSCNGHSSLFVWACVVISCTEGLMLVVLVVSCANKERVVAFKGSIYGERIGSGALSEIDIRGIGQQIHWGCSPAVKNK